MDKQRRNDRRGEREREGRRKEGGVGERGERKEMADLHRAAPQR